MSRYIDTYWYCQVESLFTEPVMDDTASGRNQSSSRQCYQTQNLVWRTLKVHVVGIREMTRFCGLGRSKMTM